MILRSVLTILQANSSGFRWPDGRCFSRGPAINVSETWSTKQTKKFGPSRPLVIGSGALPNVAQASFEGVKLLAFCAPL